jgi:cohesin complex subunit SCC1
LFEGGYFDEPPINEHPPDHHMPSDLGHHDSDDDFGGPPSIASSGAPPTPLQAEEPAHDDKDPFSQIGRPKDQNEAHDQTTLLQNEEESFALAPIEAPVARG